MSYEKIHVEYIIHALVILNLLKALRKRDKIINKPRILSLFPNLFKAA